MCAVFGAFDLACFKKLYKDNRSRGDAAFGLLTLRGKTLPFIKKYKGIANFDKDVRSFLPDITYFVGHTQAPTSSAQTFDEQTTHPFIEYPWIVAHNGILTNFEELKKLVPEGSYNVVDSSIIPALLKKYSPKFASKIKLLELVLGMLKGTYSIWAYNQQTHNLYIARCGSTLYADLEKGIFSSVMQLEPLDMIALQDGGLYQKIDNRIEQVGTFSQNSPFFVL
jgi:glucosamine 6-phosphate synthetase-like amidotransferase/phosphosugar isomerase protein